MPYCVGTFSVNFEHPELNPDGTMFYYTKATCKERAISTQAILITKDQMTLKDCSNDMHKFFACSKEPNVIFEQMPSLPYDALSNYSDYVNQKRRFGYKNDLIDTTEQEKFVQIRESKFKWTRWKLGKIDDTEITLDNKVFSDSSKDGAINAQFVIFGGTSTSLPESIGSGSEFRQDNFRLRFLIAVANTQRALQETEEPQPNSFFNRTIANAAANVVKSEKKKKKKKSSSTQL